MARLNGKIALVTGASRGIGRAIALELAQEGAAVAVNYQSSEQQAQEVATQIADLGGTALLVRGNVADREESHSVVQQVIDKWGRLDILVNNAGITRDRSLRKMTDEDWHSVVDTNLNSVYYCTTAAMNPMIEQRFGRIINISSVNGQTASFGQANYSASKGAIIAFTKTVALELAKFNVTVNAIAPGFTITDMLAKVSDTIQEQIKMRIPLGRFGTPEEIARAVIFLAADGDYITGQQLNINGGFYM